MLGLRILSLPNLKQRNIGRDLLKADDGILSHPRLASRASKPKQLFGNVRIESFVSKKRIISSNNSLEYVKRPRSIISSLRLYSSASSSEIVYARTSSAQDPFIDKIHALIELKQYKEATEVFDEMTALSVSPDSRTFVSLALAMAHINPQSSFNYLLKINSRYNTPNDTKPPPQAARKILSILATKLNARVDAPRVSSSSNNPRIYGKDDSLSKAQPDERRSVGLFELENNRLSEVFKVWAEKGAHELLHTFLLKHHTKPRSFDLKLVLNEAIKYNHPEEAWEIYRKFHQITCSPPVFHLAILMNAHQVGINGAKISEKVALERIQQVYDDMAKANIAPSHITYSQLLKIWSDANRPIYAANLFKMMESDPIISKNLTLADYNVMLNLYAVHKEVEKAEALFESLRNNKRFKLDKYIYTTMVKVYARVEDTDKAWAIVGEMARYGTDPIVYARYKGLKPKSDDLWPNNVTMSILLDMEGRVNGPVALIETFEGIRKNFHLTPSLNNWGALIEQLAIQKQYIACFDWFIQMLRSPVPVTLRECCYLIMLDPAIAPMTPEERQNLSIRKSARADAPVLSEADKKKWIATIHRWKEQYLKNNTLEPPRELDMEALQRIKAKLTENSVSNQAPESK